MAKEKPYDIFISYAVWVKNEWLRYITMMTKDSTKHLIPCYKEIDAYDLPKEFTSRKLQALDMGEITFFTTLIRIIKGFIPQKSVDFKVNSSDQTAQVKDLLNAAKLYTEERTLRSYDLASACYKKVLSLDPYCSEAYVGKYLSDLLSPSLNAHLKRLKMNVSIR